MPRLAHRLLLAAALLMLLSTPRRVEAWVEKRVDTSTTVIELAPDGEATIRYALSLEVHGTPLTGLTLQGIDADARPLADASVTRMQGGVATSLPQPVQVQAHLGTLDMNVPLRQGLRGQTFLFEFAYRTRLLERGLLRQRAGSDRTELAWVGPRFDDGIDSVKLVIRTATAAHPPEVASGEPAGAEEDPSNYGIVMSTLRRSEERDELELIRAHVARGEAITWRISLASSLFPGAPATSPSSALSVATHTPTRPATLSTSPPRAPLYRALPWMLLGGVLYALLVQLKIRAVRQAASVRHCRARAWIECRPAYRALLAGAMFATAVGGILNGASPSFAATALLLAMALAAHRVPEQNQDLRGPGVWKTLERAALEPVPAPALPGAWLDVGRLQGSLLLITALGAVTWAAARTFEHSAYLGVCLLLGSSALLPIFCTGRAGELPCDLLARSRRFLARVERRLARQKDLVVKPMGRFAAVSEQLDELRLSITPSHGLPGLIGLELGLELQTSLGGFRAAPVLVIRAADGSPCQRALPRGLRWMRGRTPEERACLVQPKLPTSVLCVSLVQELLVAMREPDAASPSRKNAAKSSGRTLSTAKAGTRSSPAHAT
jgi:hypothetical protein